MGQGTFTIDGKVLSYNNKIPKIDSSGSPTSIIITIATSDWTALSGASPYTYSATKTLSAAIPDNSLVELINDNCVLFANYGFAIYSATTTAVTIYSVGVPSASVNLKVEVSK